MSGISDILSDIPKLCSSCAFAAAATIFYKKTFRQDKLPVVGSLAILGLFLDLGNKYPFYSCVGASATTIFLSYLCYRNFDWLKSALKMDFYFVFFLAVIDARFNLCNKIGLPFPYWTNFRILVGAIPQFLRKPLWLKTKLQDVRSKLGPIYILYVSSYVMTRDVNGTHWSHQIGVVAMLSAVLAGVVIRPDNSAVLDFLAYLWKLYCDFLRPDGVVLEHVPYKTNLVQRRYYHGRLMVLSLVCSTFLSAADIFFR